MLFILIWGLNYLKGRDIFQSGNKYFGVYNNVSGLSQASPIFFKGFKVGSVRSIEFHPTQPGKLLVSFVLNTELALPSNTMAQIYSLDLMGTKGVELVAGNSMELLVPGDTLLTYVVGDFRDQVSMEVLPLKDKTEKLIVKLDSVLTNVARVFTDENRQNLSAALNGFRRSMGNVDRLSGNLADSFEEEGQFYVMVSRLDSILKTFNEQSANLDTTFTNLSAFSKQLSQSDIDLAAKELKKTLEKTSTLLSAVNEGEGSMGMMLKDKELYYSLTDVVNSLNRLLVDVRHQPEKYVHFSAVDFGKKVYKPGDSYGIDGIVYQVKIAESKHPMRFDSIHVAGKYRIFEDYFNRRFIYSVGQSDKLEDINVVYGEVVTEFPQAEIIALENGRLISLKKAQRNR